MATAITSEHPARIPPGGRTAPLSRGPRRMPAASAEPDAALPAVASLAVSEISGSRALWTGRVRLMATVFAAASAHTTANGASSSTTTATDGGRHGLGRRSPATALASPAAGQPARRDGGRQRRGTSRTTAMTLAPRTPWTA